MSRSSKISFASYWAAVQRSCTERRSPASMGSRKLDVRPRYTHPCLACRRRSKCKRNFSTFANRSLGLDAADDALARFFGGNERATLAQRVRSKPDLLPQLVHLAGNGDVLALAFAHTTLERETFALHAEIVAGSIVSVHRAGPRGADRAFSAGDFDDQVVLEAGDALRDGCVGIVGEAQQRREVVVHAFIAAGTPVPERPYAERVAV